MTWIKQNKDLQTAADHETLATHTCEICGGRQLPATSSGRGELLQQQALWSRCTVDVKVPLLCISKAATLGETTLEGARFYGGSADPKFKLCDELPASQLKCYWYFEMVQRGLFYIRGVFQNGFYFGMRCFIMEYCNNCVVPLKSEVL